jgi:hypothetical protein
LHSIFECRHSIVHASEAPVDAVEAFVHSSFQIDESRIDARELPIDPRELSRNRIAKIDHRRQQISRLRLRRIVHHPVVHDDASVRQDCSPARLPTGVNPRTELARYARRPHPSTASSSSEAAIPVPRERMLSGLPLGSECEAPNVIGPGLLAIFPRFVIVEVVGYVTMTTVRISSAT